MNGTKNILVIDRDKLVCKIIKIFLENTGKYRVTYSTDVVKGIMFAMSKRVKLILFDDRVQMSDGLNLSEHMRSNMKRPVPLLPTGAVIDRAGLKMPHTELNAIFKMSVLKRIDALVK
jgi:DNA-binding NtrC family response regulator